MAMRESMKGNFTVGEELSLQGLEIGRGWMGFQSWSVNQTMGRLREQGRLPPIDPVTQMALGVHQVLALALAAVSAGDRGDIAEARAMVERGGDLRLDDLPKDSFWLINLALLAEACTIVDDLGHASQLYAMLEPHKTRPVLVDHGSVCFGSVARLLGGLATVLDRFDDAERHFKRAMEDHTRWGARPALARTRMNYADMLIRRDALGDREKARCLLNEALPAAREMGMIKVAADCEALLAEAV